MLRIGVDIGGTFTDFAIWKDEGDGYVDIGSHKAPTSRPNFADAVKQGVQDLVARYGVAYDSPILVVHGTTVSTNAVIERSEPPIALITTKGYRDLLGIARLRLDKPVDLFNRRTTPLVPRENVFAISERILSDGSEDAPLDEMELITAVETAVSRGLNTMGVCFLHAHRNPAHEKQALELIRDRFPDVEVMASHEVWPQQSEYERAMLTLLNVYVKRLMEGYLKDIDDFLGENYPNAKLYITKSNGGIMSAAEARELPIHTLLSGPAAGVTAAQTLGRYLGVDRILTFDMGGTSADVSLVDGGRPMITAQAEVGDFPLMMPVTAVEAIGAGGGSIVWLDGGVLKVGPRSAGSMPGPACYGLGGTAPTLSDAYLITNYLSPKGLLGGRVALDRALAEKAFAPVAEALGTDVVSAAESAIDVATSNMLAKISPFLARLGVGASDLTLMIFGGAGGVHGPILASEINIGRMVVPRLPSVFCAFGGLVSDLVHDAVRAVQGQPLTRADVFSIFAVLAEEGRDWLKRQSHEGQVKETEFMHLADMRYTAQSFTLSIDLSAVVSAGDGLDAIVAAFHAEHERLFGHANPEAPVSIDTLRVRTVGRQAKPGAAVLAGAGTEPQAVERRRVRSGGRWLEDVPVYAWSDLSPHWAGAGPAIIQQDLATILVPPGYAAQVGALGDLELVKD
ncbi:MULTISPECIES: hydantoinase/oxoprolinase family protein [unclassified Chelatococcus]|uniref:hydantoinase/oxoprolinase family protein n=1 Tax=unclassified Chelatococcus TaxID=2638111 RepID=UPI001BCEFF01|nr:MULTISPECIES: hydantoinase/oxoprolinase family protein [unclassified Chelatococcus]MBS7701100.1 hydantoinase/oxoprolinase family protein [Chelatococcus sp. YT9]MBX3557231.1 hydantoinase/oxoprolinase family protein [Chelatococcus sp.]